jgi:hypothetical protein
MGKRKLNNVGWLVHKTALVKSVLPGTKQNENGIRIG